MTACMTPGEIAYPWDTAQEEAGLAQYDRLPVPPETELLPNGMRKEERATFDHLGDLKLNAGRK